MKPSAVKKKTNNHRGSEVASEHETLPAVITNTNNEGKYRNLCWWINILLLCLLISSLAYCWYLYSLVLKLQAQSQITASSSLPSVSVCPDVSRSTELQTTNRNKPIIIEERNWSWEPINATKADLYTPHQKRQEALRLYQKAATFSGEQGEGRQGWLHLLAAFSYDSKHKEIIHNLISNYQALQYDSIGYSTLLDSQLSTQDRNQLMPDKQQELLSKKLQTARQAMETVPTPEQDCSSVLFSTVVSRWNMSHYFPDNMNQQIYDFSIEQYEKLKQEQPQLSSTDLNHAFFKVQMSNLDVSSSYWGPFKDIEGFPDLVAMMRKSAAIFLQKYHGWDEEAVQRKASHPLVVWVSVHTVDSVHQPHVTEDALIGGVYYVSVPQGSGKLHMFDPRGKHPLYDLQVPTSPPNPPFHRIVSLAPKESLLVLFPGWLVHSVGNANVKSFGRAKVSNVSAASKLSHTAKYRVSLSLNLKGEWTDTSSAGFGCPTYSSAEKK
jgi:uncharacterized protein (TIGR02466 family)